MKALVYTGPKALSFADVPDPDPKPGEERVRVIRSGICGSDMHAYLGHDDRRPAPLILGHEAAGVVDGGPRDGERVTINPLVGCGRCPACEAGRDNLCPERQIISMPPREGAFAQTVTAPGRNLIGIPDAMSFAQAALAEPLAVCWHAVRLALEASAWPASRALVIGGGPIGVGAALCLRAQTDGSVLVSEPSAGRRNYLESVADLRVVAPDDIGGDAEFDLVVDAVGIEATRAAASALVRPGGVIAHVGLGSAAGGLDIRRMTLQEITFIGTYTYTPDDFVRTVGAMADGRLGALNWIEERPLSAGAAAFDDILAGRVAAPKIILDPDA